MNSWKEKILFQIVSTYLVYPPQIQTVAQESVSLESKYHNELPFDVYKRYSKWYFSLKLFIYLFITVQDLLTGCNGSNEAVFDRKWKSLLWLKTLFGLLISSFSWFSIFGNLVRQSKEFLTRIFTATTIAPTWTSANRRFLPLSLHSVVIIPRLRPVWHESITKYVSSWWFWLGR